MRQYNDLQLRYRRGTTTSRGSPASSSLELCWKAAGGGEGVDAAVTKQNRTILYFTRSEISRDIYQDNLGENFIVC
mgnify:CR=1 FL=1